MSRVGKLDLLMEKLDEAHRLADYHGFIFWPFWANVWQGHIVVQQGDIDAGIHLMQQGIEGLHALGSACVVYYKALLAEALSRVNQRDDAFRLIREALAQIEAWKEGFHEAEIHRLKGQVYLAGDPPQYEDAERCFVTALEIARRQRAKSWELRAAMSLARLWQQQGRGEDARQVLAGVYGWFTEGFDTADLQEARALLEALA
ncbi:MAG: hypothetical protein HYX89_07295 [Chloroflexi bacterium]|nr:hypothetical protein [Chloroflexota bacterium]